MTEQKADDPKAVTVGDGLAKMHEAAEQLTEEEIEALAEEARAAAKNINKERPE